MNGGRNVLVGGALNRITNGNSSVISGGQWNLIAHGGTANLSLDGGTIGGGVGNTLTNLANSATIGGGYYNFVDIDFGFIGGGRYNAVLGESSAKGNSAQLRPNSPAESGSACPVSSRRAAEPLAERITPSTSRVTRPSGMLSSSLDWKRSSLAALRAWSRRRR